MRHTSFGGRCPAPRCSCTVVHTCAGREPCRVDIGLQLAQHVASMHPELVYSDNEISRRQLTAQVARRTN
jgi:hypothetical protein